MDALFKIFPNADKELFKHYLIRNKFKVEDALYSYGLFMWEFDKYKREIEQLKKEVETMKGGLKK